MNALPFPIDMLVAFLVGAALGVLLCVWHHSRRRDRAPSDGEPGYVQLRRGAALDLDPDATHAFDQRARTRRSHGGWKRTPQIRHPAPAGGSGGLHRVTWSGAK